MQAKQGKEMVEWIIKWNNIIEPHIFTFAQPEIQCMLKRTCPEEWISFVDNEISRDMDAFFARLLALMKLSDPSIQSFRDEDILGDNYWPKSMIGFINEAKMLTISREIFGNFQYTNDVLCISKMGKKKHHEVELLSKMVLQYANQYDVQGIVDVGSGSGYLTVELSKYYPILAIDGDESQIRHSQKRFTSCPEFHQKITHIVQRLDSQSLFDILSEYDLIQVGDRLEFQKSLIGKGNSKILITCLHACGDLSSQVILNSFINCSWVACVISIGCCYQMLSPKGFPLSNTIKSHTMEFNDKYPFNNQTDSQNLFIPTYRILNCACQTMVGFSDKRITDIWKAFAYRCLLEGFLESRNQNSDISQPRLSIGTLKKDAFSNGFINYALSARPDLYILKPQLIEFEESCSYPILLGRIAFVSTMRRFYGPVMESLLLYDRYKYVSENRDFEVELKNVFRHEISPRNVALVAVRKTKIQSQAMVGENESFLIRSVISNQPSDHPSTVNIQ